MKSLLRKDEKRRKLQPYGGVAQLGEHLPCKQGVMGSNPIISTINRILERVNGLKFLWLPFFSKKVTCSLKTE